VDTIYIENARGSPYSSLRTVWKKNPGLSGNIYFISQGEPVFLWEMVNNILKAAGLDPVTRSMPRFMAWMIGAVLEWIYKNSTLTVSRR
jgi:hypothetical protein